MRKLASIQIVNTVEPIPNADAIEKIRVLGWWVVVKKGEFRSGDKVVYCEIDSLLPERPEFEFLRSGCYRPAILDGETVTQRAGFRIKTVKLRGQVSQGICFPLAILPPDAPTAEGTDVTELLNIIKYEAPIPAGLSGKVKGGFPGFLQKTDEIRIQVLEPVLERHRGKTFALTEKLDGTSFTAFLREDVFGICSRNLWMDDADESNLMARLARQLNLKERLQAIRARHGIEPALQGELIGPGIQKNKYALKAIELRIFSLFDAAAHRYLDHGALLGVLRELDLQPVPQLGTLVLNHAIDELVALAVGPSVLNPKVQREGLVLRPLTEEEDPDIGGRLSFKVINPQFLLKYEE